MIDGCLNFILIQSWLWIFKLFIGTHKYMAMWVVAVFVGPGKTVHRLAASNTLRMTGMPYEEMPDVYRVERAKVILWMVWSGLYWIWVIVGVGSMLLANGANG